MSCTSCNVACPLLQGPSAWNGKYYQYRITVFCPDTQQLETLITSDPYSLSLAADGTHTQVRLSRLILCKKCRLNGVHEMHVQLELSVVLQLTTNIDLDRGHSIPAL